MVSIFLARGAVVDVDDAGGTGALFGGFDLPL